MAHVISPTFAPAVSPARAFQRESQSLVCQRVQSSLQLDKGFNSRTGITSHLSHRLTIQIVPSYSRNKLAENNCKLLCSGFSILD